MNYLDFDLEIGQGSGRDYPVVARSQAAGEARATLRFPYDELQLESRLKDLRIALLLTGLKHRRVLSREEQVVQDFGRDLFNALMVGKIGERYRVALNEAAGQGAGLRLRLRLLAAELAALPWEYLYDPDLGEYVCLSGETPIVRYVELPRVIPPLALEPPLRILGMIASPSDQEDPLDVETEKQRVAEAVKPLSKKGLVSLAWLDGQTWRDLQRKLREGPWHVFHFIGHGGYHRPTEEGVIILADEQGRSHPFTATQLGRLLAGHKSLRLALLNACEGARGSERDIFSSTAATLVQHGLPAVLAMQYPITDRTAIELARAFYEAVADGFPVDAAVVEARRAITFARHNTVEWGTPVLYMRSPDGVLFKSPPPAPSPSQGEGRGEGPAPSPSQGEGRGEGRSLARLRQQLIDHFNLEELRTLCFDLGVDYENLPGEGKAGKARELITYLDRRGRLAELVEACKGLRPQISWPVEEPAPPGAAYREEPAPLGALRSPSPYWTLPYGEPDWVEIPAGEFWMGSEKGQDNEKPLHRVYLDSYWIARTPVTNAQYQLFVQASKHRPPHHWSNGKMPQDLADHPVVNVSWDDTLAYCQWLSQATGKAISLPSEAQWEKAARGDQDQREYPWSDTFGPKKANTEEAGRKTTTPVGRYPGGASPYGILDMSGNVWEWCTTRWWNEQQKEYRYPYTADDGREDLSGGDNIPRVLRGGSWYFDKTWARCAARLRYYPRDRSIVRGFRCCCVTSL